MKKYILGLITGILICGGIGIVIATTYRASDISYSPNDNTWNVINVQGAIDDLKNEVNLEIKDHYFETSYGTQTPDRSVTKLLNKGKYIVIVTDGIGTKYNNGNTVLETDIMSIVCDKQCNISKADEHFVHSSSWGYYHMYSSIYLLDVLEDNTTISSPSNHADVESTNQQIMTMQILKMR